MNDRLITREMADVQVQKAFDLAYQDDTRDGEVDADDVVGAIRSTCSVATVRKMLQVTGAASVGEMVFMYLDGRTQTEK